MTYQEAKLYIKESSKSGITLGLDSIKNLLRELGNPQDDLKFIHIAGTNGKGSVLAYISTIMEVAGYKTGRYISPTVEDYRERIQINRTNISKNDFTLQLSRIKKAIERMLENKLPHPSVFEIETALGFLYFKEQGCDIVIMETGMGGVTDATNIIQNTLVSIFTSISRDHMEYLGNTIADLTRAKAGIIKKESSVVYGGLPKVSENIIIKTANHFNCSIFFADFTDVTTQKSKRFTQMFSYRGLDDVTIQLLGKHQIENATLAIEAVRALQGFNITDNQIKKGLSDTKWFARVTIVKEHNPVIVIDGAHNQGAVRALAKTLADLFPTEKIVGVMGVFKDKEINEMLAEIKPIIDKIHAISLPDEKRTLSADALAGYILDAKIEADSHYTIKNALDIAVTEAEVVVVFGSFSFLKKASKYVYEMY